MAVPFDWTQHDWTPEYRAFVDWFYDKYGFDPTKGYGITQENYTTITDRNGNSFYDIYQEDLSIIASGETPPSIAPETIPTTPAEGDDEGEGDKDTNTIPEGYQSVAGGSLLYDPSTGKYYDYSIFYDRGQLVWIPEEEAKKRIAAYESGLSPSTSTTTLGGLPSKEQSADGAWWWVYRDKDGNIINVEEVADDETEMTAYEKAQYDLQKEQIAWEREQAAISKAEQEAQKYTSPREWIQRWGVTNPGSLPNAPSWLHETTGLNPNQPISAVTPKLMSGQSMSNMAPSELEGLYGFVDWTGGRGGKYASGEDYGYAAQKLLPTNAPRRTYSWNPNSRT